jgi:ABC-type branched-subunit amino acid transport system ATPase component
MLAVDDLHTDDGDRHVLQGVSLTDGPNLAFAPSVADRVHVMNRGRIVHCAASGDLRGDEAVKTRYLGIGDARR